MYVPTVSHSIPARLLDGHGLLGVLLAALLAGHRPLIRSAAMLQQVHTSAALILVQLGA